jgi:gliding motility-associated lipoprotein GldD
MYKVGFVFTFLFVVLFMACNSPFVPKVKGYEKVNLPNKQYQLFNDPGYAYTFEYPKYAKIERKLNYFGDNTQTNGWININFPSLNGTIYVSYKDIKPHELDTLVKDAYTFANNHNSMANLIEDSVFTTKNGVHGVFFHIGGNVATNYQFFLTDSANKFFRGVLYFDSTPNEDSLAPINAFLFKDLEHLVNSFRWK